MAKFELPSATTGPISRRGLIVGAAGVALLAACGSGDDTSGSGSSGTDSSGTEAGSGDAANATVDADETYTIAKRFPPDVQEPGNIRLAISLSDADGRMVSDGPDTLVAQVLDIDAKPIGDPISAVKRSVEPAPYYAFRVALETPGVYYLVVDGGPTTGAAFQVMEPGSVAVAGPGDPLPPFDTPTVDDPRGVDPTCTRQPEPCPFHEITLTEALELGKPIVYLIGTPAFCQTGTCAPALESIIDIQDEYGDDVVVVHAEVYTDTTATEPAPAVDAAKISFEPVLFITDAEGVVVERLDAVWDQTELAEILGRLSG